MAAIEKRGESSYRLTVSCGYDKEGKKLMKRKTIDLAHIKPNKRDEEAKKQWILFKDEVEKGIYFDSGKISFEDFIERWLKDYAEHELAPKTLFRYKEILNSRVIPSLGHIKLMQLQPTHLNEFYNNLREKGIRLDKKYSPKKNISDILTDLGYTPKDIVSKSGINERTLKSIINGKNAQSTTVKKICESLKINNSVLFDPVEQDKALAERTILHHHRLISSILTCAVQWGFLLNNPATRVKAPKVQKTEARHYDIEQTNYIFDLIENEPIKYRTMILLSVFGGMREGELTALKWEDVDFDNRLLRINKALQYLPRQEKFIKSTKNDTSNRIISLPPSVFTALKNYKIWQNGEKAKLGNLWHENNFIFTAPDGKAIFPSTISKWFKQFIERHNEAIMNAADIKKEDKEEYLLDEVNFHGLRHTSATILIKQGVDVPTVSKRLGHARPSTTNDIYAHSLKEADTEAAEKFENLFYKKKQNKNQV